MISNVNNGIIAKLPNNQVLVLKQKAQDRVENKYNQQVSELKKRDAEVRAHESAHLSNPDVIAVGGPRFTYVLGPDGKPYAVGGKVTVSTGRIKNPREALSKALALKNASVGAGEVSPHDLQSASSAQSMVFEALSKMKRNVNFNANTNFTPNNLNATDFYSNNKNNNSILNSSNLDIYA